MTRKTVTMAALAATMITAMVPAMAMAQDRYRGEDAGYHQQQDRHGGWNQDRGGDRGAWNNDRGGDHHGDSVYRRDGGYQGRYSYDARQGHYNRTAYDQGYYRNSNYRYRCQGSGTTGTIVGALAGGLIGHGIAGRGDRTLGLLLGGGAGALAGRAIDKSNSHC